MAQKDGHHAYANRHIQTFQELMKAKAKRVIRGTYNHRPQKKKKKKNSCHSSSSPTKLPEYRLTFDKVLRTKPHEYIE